MQIQENVPLAPLTTFGIGGSARFFAHVQDIQEIVEALSFAKKEGLRVLLLGGGSNMLVPDAGWSGLVLKIELKGIEIEDNLLIAAAGEGWDELVAKAVKENLWGLENLSGIPGTVGGAVVQNIGAYGAALSQSLEWVEVLDTETSEIKKLSNAECAFGYRESIFKKMEGKFVVLRAAYMLSKEAKANVSYKDLATRFNDTSLDLSEIRAAVLEIRKAKFPDTTKEGTAGSFFKNLILPKAEAERLKAHYSEMPLFDMPETLGVKVPLAWLLDHVLHANGRREGGVRFFEKQPLVIVADFGTRASDVQAFVQKIKKEVKEKLQIEIEEEVKVIL